MYDPCRIGFSFAKHSHFKHYTNAKGMYLTTQAKYFFLIDVSLRSISTQDDQATEPLTLLEAHHRLQ